MRSKLLEKVVAEGFRRRWGAWLGDRICGCAVAARPNLRASAEQCREEHGIEGAVGKEWRPREDDLVVGRCQRQPTAHDTAVLVEFDVGEPLHGRVEECLRVDLAISLPALRQAGGEIMPADWIPGGQHPEDRDTQAVGTGSDSASALASASRVASGKMAPIEPQL